MHPVVFRIIFTSNTSKSLSFTRRAYFWRSFQQQSNEQKQHDIRKCSTQNNLNTDHHPCIDTSNSSNSQVLLKDINIFENFLTESEEYSLLSEILPYVKRLRYEFDHWDNAIHGYRETEKLNWNEKNTKILNRVLLEAFPAGVSPLRHVHVLDLSKEGYIKPHVDSVRFCGDTIAGLSLLSDSVMRLVHEHDSTKILHAFLPKRSLYILRKSIRYEYTHEILEDKISYFRGKHVPRNRRISVICRNEPNET